jgi:hypothetical protein
VILNKINGKYYYGKTFNIKNRWNKHIFNANKKINRHLYDAMNHYGYENFSIHQISEIIENKDIITKKLNELETSFISLTNAQDSNFGYNMSKGGDGGYLGEEAVEKMAAKKRGVALSKEHKDNIGKGNKGKNKDKHRTEEEKQHLSNLYEGKTYEEIYGEETAKLKKEHASKTMKGRKRKPFSKKWKENIGKASAERFKKQRELKISSIDTDEIENLLKNNIKSNEIPNIFKVDIRMLNFIFIKKYGMTLYKYSQTMKK